jgi:hypothetical protein
MRQIMEATAEKSGLKIILQSTILISLYYYL